MARDLIHPCVVDSHKVPQFVIGFDMQRTAKVDVERRRWPATPREGVQECPRVGRAILVEGVEFRR